MEITLHISQLSNYYQVYPSFEGEQVQLGYQDGPGAATFVDKAVEALTPEDQNMIVTSLFLWTEYPTPNTPLNYN